MDNDELLAMLDSIDLKLSIDGKHGRAVAKNRAAIEVCRAMVMEKIKEESDREFEYNAEVAKIYLDKVHIAYHKNYSNEPDEAMRALVDLRCNKLLDAAQTIDKMRETFKRPRT